MSGTRLAPVLLLGLALAACQAERPPARSGFGPLVEVCDASGCRVQPTAAVTAELRSNAASQRQEDPCLHRGESLAALQAAAWSGDPRAACVLGEARERGAGGLPRDGGAAARAYGQAADAGDPFAQHRLAQLVTRGAAPGGRTRAVALTRAAAEGGVAQAQYAMGIAHATGRGVSRDAGESARWLALAAENGVPEAQYALATMLFRGEGVAREPFAAISSMRRAAQGGLLEAQKALGRLHMTGLEEMGQDLNEARTWLSAAAARGDADSARWLREVDRARADEFAFSRQLALQAEQTRAWWHGAVLASLFAPRVYVYHW